MKNFKEFRNAQRTYANAVLEEEETKMMETILRKYSRFRGKKDAVLVEALRIYCRTKSKRDGDR